jgi:hypothetical protein
MFLVLLVIIPYKSSSAALTNPVVSFSCLNEELVAYYKFDSGEGNIAYDYSGSGNDGTIIGATWIQGKFGSALNFDGVGDYVKIPHSDVFSFGGVQPFTLSAWIKSEIPQGIRGNPVVVKEGSYGFHFDHIEQRFRGSVVFHSNGAGHSAGYVAITEGVWHHVVGVYAPPYLLVYLDGDRAAMNYVGYLGIDPNTLDLLIGGSRIVDGELTRWFKGIIDEVRIYNRALSDDEIRALIGDLLLSVSTLKMGVLFLSNVTLLDENQTEMKTVNEVSRYSWLLSAGTYYIQASIFYNQFKYESEKIEVILSEYTELLINFLFSNLTVSCLDIEDRPLGNCNLVLVRENEQCTVNTNSSGSMYLEAYYGNWTVEAYWMGVLVGETSIGVNQSRSDLTLQCGVGDFSVVVVDPFGYSVEANVTLRNETYNLFLSDQHHRTIGNLTFIQIPLIEYDLAITGDFGTQTYQVRTDQTRQIRIETLPLSEKILFIMIGVVIGILSTLGIRDRSEMSLRELIPSLGLNPVKAKYTSTAAYL